MVGQLLLITWNDFLCFSINSNSWFLFIRLIKVSSFSAERGTNYLEVSSQKQEFFNFMQILRLWEFFYNMFSRKPGLLSNIFIIKPKISTCFFPNSYINMKKIKHWLKKIELGKEYDDFTSTEKLFTKNFPGCNKLVHNFISKSILQLQLNESKQ